MTPLERLKQKDFMLGLFLPMQQGGWSPSSAPRTTTWTFEYLKALTLMAERDGFDLVFGLAQWLGKGGYGGKIHFREHDLDPLIVNASLASVTKSIILINTVHVLYYWHPLHLAKFGAAFDHISGGRWGINIVAGYRESELRRFGLDPIPHDLRHEMAEEFTMFMEKIWSSDEEVTFKGRFWSTEAGYISPRPVNGRPIIVNAGSSGASQEFAAKYSDIIFITSPDGADFAKACASLPAHNKEIKDAGRKYGRDVRTIINPLVICRPTEKEARDVYQTIKDNVDSEAVANYIGIKQASDTKSWKGHSPANWAVGGNVQLVGTPEQVVDGFVKLREAGCDGVQVSFFDFLPDLESFGKNVIPLMKERGLFKRREA